MVIHPVGSMGGRDAQSNTGIMPNAGYAASNAIARVKATRSTWHNPKAR